MGKQLREETREEQFAGKKERDSNLLNYTLAAQVRRLHPKVVILALLDIKGAYPKTWDDALWFRLNQKGVQQELIALIIDMYNHREVAVKLRGKLTAFFKVKGGIAEGSPNSVELFHLHLFWLFHFKILLYLCF